MGVVLEGQVRNDEAPLLGLSTIRDELGQLLGVGYGPLYVSHGYGFADGGRGGMGSLRRLYGVLLRPPALIGRFFLGGAGGLFSSPTSAGERADGQQKGYPHRYKHRRYAATCKSLPSHTSPFRRS